MQRTGLNQAELRQDFFDDNRQRIVFDWVIYAEFNSPNNCLAALATVEFERNHCNTNSVTQP